MFEGLNLDANQLVEFCKGNQWVLGIVGWVVCGLYFVAKIGNRAFGGGEFTWGRVGNTLQVALALPKWRWGKDGDGNKTGASIVLDREDGKRLVANFKLNKFILNVKKTTVDAVGRPKTSWVETGLNRLLSKRELKKLNSTRDQVIANLKKTDEAESKARQQKKDDDAIAALNIFAFNRA